jgi:broad specificity phosphatase PhoE
MDEEGRDRVSAKKAVVFLARHGTPDWNRRDIRYDVPPGPPLVAQGEAEAIQLGEFLAARGVAKIYTSPLVRTQRTAELAAGVHGLPVGTSEAIAEYRREETDDVVAGRLLPFFEQIWEEAVEIGPIALVSHGGPIRVALERLGLLPDELWHYRRQFDHQNPLPPAGAWEITRSLDLNLWQARLAFAPIPFTEYALQTVYV